MYIILSTLIVTTIKIVTKIKHEQANRCTHLVLVKSSHSSVLLCGTLLLLLKHFTLQKSKRERSMHAPTHAYYYVIIHQEATPIIPWSHVLSACQVFDSRLTSERASVLRDKRKTERNPSLLPISASQPSLQVFTQDCLIKCIAAPFFLYFPLTSFSQVTDFNLMADKLLHNLTKANLYLAKTRLYLTKFWGKKFKQIHPCTCNIKHTLIIKIIVTPTFGKSTPLCTLAFGNVILFCSITVQRLILECFDFGQIF